MSFACFLSLSLSLSLSLLKSLSIINFSPRPFRPCPDKKFHSEFVDLVRFNSQGKIAQKKEFWDTGHLHNHVDEHRDNKKKDTT